ncbi:cytochrome c-type biogenesis protein H1 [Salmonella enterica subsp. enterica]|nr:cytochrome c-type biogenesis protein H1 [Salmonella enterica subsp. enterica]
MRLLPGMVMLMLALVIAGSARATTDVMPFKDEAQEQQFRQLTEQLRCPKCQNNSIADSNAMIATDMRRRVYDLMQEGKSRQEIIDYMVARYGNFVTYDPPLTPLTVLLWVLPLAAIVAGGWIIVAPHAPAGAPAPGAAAGGHPGLRRARRVGRLRAGGRHCAGRGRHQLLTDRQLSAGQGLAAGDGADARAAGAGAGPAGAAAE